MPVADDVLAHAAHRSERDALRCDGRALRYGELGGDIEAAAVTLRDAGVRPAQLVALSVADPLELLTTLLAVDLVGATPLVCDPRWSLDHQAAVLASVGPDAHVTAAPAPPSSTRYVAGSRGLIGLRSPRPDDLAWAGFSSGSTGRPRAIVRTRSSWTGCYDAVSRITGITADDTVVVPGPLASSLYGFAALHALAVGATVEVGSDWTPRRLVERLADADVVHLVPSMLADVMATLDDANVGRQGRLRTAVVGGAAFPARLRERAGHVGVGVVSYYGAAELSFVAVDVDGAGLRPFPDVQVDVRPVPDATVGEVWVRSPWLSNGYLAGAAGPLRHDARGWATVGDLADLTDVRGGADPLVLRGRGDGAILTAGATVVPEDVEAVLADVPGVAGVVVVGTGHDRLGAVVTAVIESWPDSVARSTLEAAARRSLSPAQRPRRWLIVDALPRTASGKPARAVIAERLASGTLAARPIT